MNTFRVIAALLLPTTLAVQPAFARGGGHFGSGAHFGGGARFSDHAGAAFIGRPHFAPRPFFAPRTRVFIAAPLIAAPLYYYPPPAVYYPPLYPSGYVEEQPAPATVQQYWYYCAESKTYYPYVQECPGGWQAVVPQPPAPS